MAYVRRIKTGWRVEVQRKGQRDSAVLATKAAAVAWGVKREAEILAAADAAALAYPAKTLADAVDRYAREVSVRKRGAHAERLRFDALMRDFPALCGKTLHTIAPADIAAWRDARRAAVSDSSVVREAAQLRNVWTVARNEWGWCGESPWGRVKMPPKGHARTRRTSWREVRLILRHLGFVTGRAPQTPQQEVAWAYLVAQHTALRASEARGLFVSAVDLSKRVLTLHTHKTLEREGARFVPFTRRAARVLAVLDSAARGAGREGYFTISAQSLDVLFRRARDRLLLSDLHFHDSRADALTRLSRRMDVMRLARVSGHRDLKQLLAAYYRETAADVAAGM